MRSLLVLFKAPMASSRGRKGVLSPNPMAFITMKWPFHGAVIKGPFMVRCFGSLKPFHGAVMRALHSALARTAIDIPGMLAEGVDETVGELGGGAVGQLDCLRGAPGGGTVPNPISAGVSAVTGDVGSWPDLAPLLVGHRLPALRMELEQLAGQMAGQMAGGHL